ncbi:unnamed protein product [Effrenium voratum]|nr:unnamed protein product [Effrenium voratum]
MKEDPQRLQRVAGNQDLEKCAESPLLTGRVVAALAAEEQYRKPPYVTAPGLTGRICIVAETAHDLKIRDGGMPGSVAQEVYGTDRAPAPSIRSLGFLGPGALKAALPAALQGLAAPGGLLANEEVRIPLEFMAQGPTRFSAEEPSHSLDCPGSPWLAGGPCGHRCPKTCAVRTCRIRCQLRHSGSSEHGRAEACGAQRHQHQLGSLRVRPGGSGSGGSKRARAKRARGRRSVGGLRFRARGAGDGGRGAGVGCLWLHPQHRQQRAVRPQCRYSQKCWPGHWHEPHGRHGRRTHEWHGCGRHEHGHGQHERNGRHEPRRHEPRRHEPHGRHGRDECRGWDERHGRHECCRQHEPHGQHEPHDGLWRWLWQRAMGQLPRCRPGRPRGRRRLRRLRRVRCLLPGRGGRPRAWLRGRGPHVQDHGGSGEALSGPASGGDRLRLAASRCAHGLDVGRLRLARLGLTCHPNPCLRIGSGDTPGVQLATDV